MNEALIAEEVTIAGHEGDQIPAYRAMPLDAGSRGGVVVIHHMPGWDPATKEITRRFAANGYIAVCPNLHHRDAPGASPDDAAAAARAGGGVPDERLVGDVRGAADHVRALPTSNAKVGVIGYCSGGRQSFLAACSMPLDAAVDCYGAFVVNAPPRELPLKMTPIIDRAANLSCPLLGLFGMEDKNPSPDEVARLDDELTRLGKPHEFHAYDGAGHGFFASDRPGYRVEAAVDGWRRIFSFFGEHLA